MAKIWKWVAIVCLVLLVIGAVLMYLLDPATGLLVSLGITGTPAYILAVVLCLAIGLLFGDGDTFLAEVTDSLLHEMHGSQRVQEAAVHRSRIDKVG